MANKGYCPVKPGDILNDKYKIVKQLGTGRFSTCWEVEHDGKTYAIKIQRSKKDYIESAEDEIKIFESMQTDEWSENVVQLFDNFVHESENGKHVCMVLDKMDLNLLDLLKKYKHGMPIPLVKEIAKQALNGLIFLRDNQVIHTDLKPENILIKVHDSKVSIKIGDFGGACWTHYHFTNNIGTTEYRSVENIIDADYDCAIDVWALACVIFELLTDDYLFDPHSYVDDIQIGEISDSDSESENEISDNDDEGNEDSDNDDEGNEDSDSDTEDESDEDEFLVDQMHLWLMTSILGSVPKYIQRRGNLSREFFHRAGNIRCRPSYIKERSISKILKREYNFPKDQAEEIESFLMPMLEYDSNIRATPEKMLEHSWLK